MTTNWICSICEKKANRLSHRNGKQYCDECLPEEFVYRSPSMKCKHCGKRELFGSGSDRDVAEMRELEMCFSCHHFWKLIPIKDAPSTVRVKGANGRTGHYIIGPEPDPNERTAFLGFGGSQFQIQFNDGRNVTTRNLWYQGEIPAHFDEQLPPNAVFVPTIQSVGTMLLNSKEKKS
jgi:hypothetical protein